MTDRLTTDVLVLGAGIAGLAAARALGERGLRVTVLEARDRVGGRIFTIHTDGADVELGAEFIHGRAPELWALIDEAGLKTTEREGTMLRAEADGRLVEDDPQDEEMFAPLEALTGYGGPDLAFADWLRASDVPEEDRQALVGYVEGFNAADATRIGILGLGAQQKAEDAIEGDRAWHIHRGYSQLTEFLAARVRALRCNIVLSAIVKQIEWHSGSVRVLTEAGEEFQATRCVVTLPLGVLQRVNAGGIQLHPEPPAIAAARRMEMGHAARFSMIFRRAWWEDAPVAVSHKALQAMSFLFTPVSAPAVWWTPHPEPGVAMLTAWIGGPRSSALQGKAAEELGEAACVTLAEVFGMEAQSLRNELISTQTHDWANDPFSCGAYSYVPVDALEVPRAMTEPVENTLFFAGEHTDITGHWGTAHAALRSGLRAAAQILGDDVD